MGEDLLLKNTIEKVKDFLSDEIKEITVERAVIGLFFTGVKLNVGEGGVCFTPIKEIPEAVCCPSSARAMPMSGKLSGRGVEKYLKDIFSGNIMRRTLGIATLNALSAYCWSKGIDRNYEIIEGKDAFDDIVFENGEKTVVVGALVPVLRTLIAGNHDFRVLEMDASTLKGKELDHFSPSQDYPLYVPEADHIIITGVTILNDTLMDILKEAKPGAEILVTGPTASMLPDAFFDEGVTAMGGILVTKPDELLDVISEGGSGYHFFGKSAERLVIRKNE
ncbi:MAG: DUF364 domain-containing protein [Methanobrevibacter sp.]|uniref:DUF364 domain-containing protein n=1 Tax=Methanobrevibacter sp. TaxID=66852 RepID=UPI0026DF1C3F|nr:DUF364 domain-containing protein [Methanobrevibacter sp.]MDO5849025.1 DUF364 domain-containing protein [Methanobrevibacter sp.]